MSKELMSGRILLAAKWIMQARACSQSFIVGGRSHFVTIILLLNTFFFSPLRIFPYRPQFTFKPRNFDPLTRQPIKRQKTILEQQQADEAGEEAEEIDGVKTGVDSSLTVEDRVRGVAERVIAEDERKRGEELVSDWMLASIRPPHLSER